jgi:RNA polymerase sigma factor (sigma-70 family)
MSEPMASALSDQLATLFGTGTCAGLTDGELLERFRTGRDEAGERAFEALVTRHGPMVLGICRNFVEDPTDAHDAFQAVFLILARRAGAIRKSESVGSWLYGVTVRVAARARATAIRRRIRERRVLAAASAVALAGGSPEASPGHSVEHDDGVAVVHEEVVRLPERYRTPIVLCYFEGLTHDEAAARLSWPVGTVRSRLARARDRLRSRLTRRGVAAPSTIGPLAAWLIAGQFPATASAAIRAAAAVSPLPVHVPAALAHAAVKVAAGQPATAGAWSAASLNLADGVLQIMMLKKLTVAGCLVATLGVGTGTGALVIRGARAQVPLAPGGAPQAQPAAQDAPAPPLGPLSDLQRLTVTEIHRNRPGIDPQLKRVLATAMQRLDAQRAYYEEGRITIDRFIAASADFERIELLAAKNADDRRAVRQRHIDRLKLVAEREQAELLVGRGSAADVSESVLAYTEAEYMLEAAEKGDAEKAALLRRIAELERKVELLQKERGGQGRP